MDKNRSPGHPIPFMGPSDPPWVSGVAPNGAGGLSSKPVCGVDKWPWGSRQASLPPNLGRIRKTSDYWPNSPRQGAGARITRRAPGTKKGEADAR